MSEELTLIRGLVLLGLLMRMSKRNKSQSFMIVASLLSKD